MLADVRYQSTIIPSSTEQTASLRVDAAFMMDFNIELSLINAVLCPKKVKAYLRVDAELHQKKVRGLTQFRLRRGFAPTYEEGLEGKAPEFGVVVVFFFFFFFFLSFECFLS